MSTIYVIVNFGGQYEDAWEINLFARRTRKAAETAVQELQERASRMTAANKLLVANFEKLRTEIPLSLIAWPVRPVGPAKQNKENLAAYKKALTVYHAENKRIAAINRERQLVWNEKVSACQREFAKHECGLSDADLTGLHFPISSIYCFAETGDYRIDELVLQ